MKANRLSGHSLPHEGRVIDGMTMSSGPGVSVCACGTPSPNLPNASQRKKWHHDHKNDIRSERGLALMDAHADGREATR